MPTGVLLPEQFDWAGGSRGGEARRRRAPTSRGRAYEMARGQAIKHRIFVHAGSIMEAIDGEDRLPATRQSSSTARARKSPATARSTCLT